MIRTYDIKNVTSLKDDIVVLLEVNKQVIRTNLLMTTFQTSPWEKPKQKKESLSTVARDHARRQRFWCSNFSSEHPATLSTDFLWTGDFPSDWTRFFCKLCCCCKDSYSIFDLDDLSTQSDLIELVHSSRVLYWQGWQKGGKYSYFPGRREILVIPGKYW